MLPKKCINTYIFKISLIFLHKQFDNTFVHNFFKKKKEKNELDSTSAFCWYCTFKKIKIGFNKLDQKSVAWLKLEKWLFDPEACPLWDRIMKIFKYCIIIDSELSGEITVKFVWSTQMDKKNQSQNLRQLNNY